MAHLSRSSGRTRCRVRYSKRFAIALTSAALVSVCAPQSFITHAAAQDRSRGTDPYPRAGSTEQPVSPQRSIPSEGFGNGMLGGAGATASLEGGATSGQSGRGSIRALRPSLEQPPAITGSIPSVQSIDERREALFRELADEFTAFDRLGNLVRKVSQLVKPSVIHIEAHKSESKGGTMNRMMKPAAASSCRPLMDCGF